MYLIVYMCVCVCVNVHDFVHTVYFEFILSSHYKFDVQETVDVAVYAVLHVCVSKYENSLCVCRGGGGWGGLSIAAL